VYEVLPSILYERTKRVLENISMVLMQLDVQQDRHLYYLKTWRKLRHLG
jgi:hypothetical protein